MKTTDLGQGWWVDRNDDGSMTILNYEQGQNIELPPASVETLRHIFKTDSEGDQQ